MQTGARVAPVFFSRPWMAGMPGLSRPSMASEALGLLPIEMQEHF